MNHKAEERSCKKLAKSYSITLQVKIFGYTILIICPRYRLCLTDEDNYEKNNDMVYLYVRDHRWACSGLVGCGTILRMGSRGFDYRLIFFSIYVVFPATLWPWTRFSHYQKSVTIFFLEGKGKLALKADNLSTIH
jgi:hypothetical protein